MIKKSLSIVTLLLLSIAAPSTAYNVKSRYHIQTAPTQSIPVPTNLGIQKPKNIKPASITRRACAFLIDTITLYSVVPLLFAIAGIKYKHIGVPGSVYDISPSYWYLCYIGTILLELFSLGKYVVNVKQIDINHGQEASLEQALIRALVKYPPFVLLFLVNKGEVGLSLSGIWFFICAVSALADDNGRSIPDRVANTVLVKVDTSIANV